MCWRSSDVCYCFRCWLRQFLCENLYQTTLLSSAVVVFLDAFPRVVRCVRCLKKLIFVGHCSPLVQLIPMWEKLRKWHLSVHGKTLNVWYLVLVFFIWKMVRKKDTAISVFYKEDFCSLHFTLMAWLVLPGTSRDSVCGHSKKNVIWFLFFFSHCKMVLGLPVSFDFSKWFFLDAIFYFKIISPAFTASAGEYMYVFP